MGDVFLENLWFHRVDGVRIENVVVEGELVVVRARATAERGGCSGCGVKSARVHSRYVRRLEDSAVGHRRVVIDLQVRRFRCGEGACPQTTFAEQVGGLIFRYGRRSAGLQVVLQKLALMLVGRAGARLGHDRGSGEPFHAAAPDTGPTRTGSAHAESARRAAKSACAVSAASGYAWVFLVLGQSPVDAGEAWGSVPSGGRWG
ncbi:transposase family protein [Streptomyces phaeochromogenes]|uniref:transposase family protein n=1 Tax=Streptomyces phaeochromogenes TaxID=1923 RepID=UPI002DDC39B7|nr:transposase family protein [Streptomyces phaeochromogenes]WRZ34608.1 transposase family protein [Streptomyces phaeochromogenes]